jgi:hypothetical protein
MLAVQVGPGYSDTDGALGQSDAKQLGTADDAALALSHSRHRRIAAKARVQNLAQNIVCPEWERFGPLFGPNLTRSVGRPNLVEVCHAAGAPHP